ncbi:hypothetical protein C7H83_10220 [Tetragenococcus halophilus]|uniref:Uncharacterized protein n=1 Tax=Tetragenococcus halophilus TaxID=51669 RepID=A0A3G5FKD9_TETHA|nr:hypothetical protein [Tetragenococcus halophilus]AYW50816.1 hypothetical protein C7H83_10220 [Tetragenococcus halophilus]GBD64900.1 hypothetical protein TEHD23766T_2327 [Tetragenococcus halophilus subsp. flandriensis]GMA08910.1 hypothetical protein GCM10025886_20610 [Tetragenococcus halophilus subsp. flandriensis]
MVEINTQLKTFWVGYADGWHQVIAHLVMIDNVEYAMVPQTTDNEEYVLICLYHSKSGKLIQECPISLKELLRADTKEATMKIFENIAKGIEPILKYNKTKILHESENYKLAMEKEFGPMPEIEDSHELDYYEE